MTASGDQTAAVFARRVREARLSRGWLLRDLAEASGVGISTLSRAETGARVDITLGTAERIARGLGVPLAALLPDVACGHCLDDPPRGFTCQQCGTPGPAVVRG
jgi:transcriptional regulator with XRE-family HTH domain